MIFKSLLFITLCTAVVVSLPFGQEDLELAEHEPHVYIQDDTVREKRSPQFSLSGQGSEKYGYVRADGQRTLFQNDRTRIDGHAGYQRNWGGGPKHGLDIGASATQNIWRSRDRSASLDANANFNRHIGAGRPIDNYGGGLTFTKRF